MRFIVELESTYAMASHPSYEKMVTLNKQKHQAKIGDMIADSFGWQDKKFNFCIRHSIEVEAFPMKDYLDFKKNLIDYLIQKGINPDVIHNKFKIIESISR
jgi:hypothetical protein